MKTSSTPALLPANVSARLFGIAAKERRTTLAGYAARIAGTILVLALTAMVTDRVLRFFHPAWRWTATLAVAGGAGAAAWYWRRQVKWRASPLAAARAAEQEVPGIEERWSTLASLSAGAAPDSVRGAESLLARVRDEASTFAATVPARTVAGRPEFVRGMLWLAVGAALAGIFHLTDPPAAGVRWHRLLAPWSDVSLTRVSVEPQPVPVVVPRHEICELQAKVSGRIVSVADLILRDAMGNETSIRLAAGDEAGRFTHVLRDPQEAFSFRFRAGDGQTPWYRVAVADRPVIASASVTVTPPSYTGHESETQQGIPPSVRALEGSQLTVRLKTGSRRNSVALLILRAAGETPEEWPLAAGPDGYFTWNRPLTESFRFQPVLKSVEGLTNQTPPVCMVEVTPDRAPVVTLTENSATKALTPADTVEVAFTASDDVGIQRVEIVVKLEQKGVPSREIIIPVAMNADKGSRRVEKKVPLDLSKLPLKPGMKISYAVRAADGKGAEAEAGSGEGGKSLLADEQDKKKADAGGGAPPGTMATRNLDAGGQCSCSADRDLEIEEFTGESPAWREKASIPVLPVLEKITAAVRAALLATTAARHGLPPRTALDEARGKKVSEAAAHVSIAAGECEGLATRTKDTPYALIGLQLRELRERDLAAAEGGFKDSQTQKDAGPPLALADIHLRAALDWLERITRAAASIQKHEAAEALAQKIKQMHRIFLEDSMKLLEASGGAGGPNAPELPLVELSEEYARLLKERMEKMQELMKELAKLLDSDPALRAKFLDGKSKGIVALQEQLRALQAEQEGLGVQTASLAAATAGAARDHAIAALKAECLGRHQALAVEVARILRAAVTWLPKGVSKEEGAGRDLLQALLAASVALPNDPSAAMKEIDRAMSALNGLSPLPGAASYAHLRREELITVRMTAVWLDALLEAAAARKMGRVAELKQRDLTRRTMEFSTKVEGGMAWIASTWPAVEKLAVAVRSTLFQATLPHQRSAAPLLRADHWAEGRTSQQEAAKGLASAAKAWTELVNAVAEEMKKNPPPPPGAPDGDMPDLAALLALMENEATEMDDYGLPQWKSNIQIISDWQQNCSGSAAGAMPQPSPAGALRAAQERERALASQAAKAQAAANARAREQMTSEEAAEGSGDGAGNNTANTRRNDWNRLPSELNKDLRQQSDAPPPEEYRHAVEVYFRRIGVERGTP